MAGSRRICATSRCGLMPDLALARISSSLPTRPSSRWAVASCSPASVAPPSEPAEPNLTSPEIRSWTTRTHALDTDRLACVQVLLGGGVGVDHHSARPRPAAADELQRAELRLGRIDAEAEVGSAPGGDRLAVLDQLQAARDVADRLLDVRQRLHAGQQRLRERRAPRRRPRRRLRWLQSRSRCGR